MTSNIRPVHWSGAPAFEVTDFTLFMYGLVRGDVVLVGSGPSPVYAELGVYELDGFYRLGIPYFEYRSWLTRLSGLVTASRVEFSVAPDRQGDLRCLGQVSAVGRSAFRGSRGGPNS